MGSLQKAIVNVSVPGIIVNEYSYILYRGLVGLHDRNFQQTGTYSQDFQKREGGVRGRAPIVPSCRSNATSRPRTGVGNTGNCEKRRPILKWHLVTFLYNNNYL